jgi:phosphohistidine phosphatase
MADVIEIYIVRHGLAAERGEAWPDDTKRPLTSEGIARLRREVQALQRLDVDFDLILSSPLVRARQTADLFAQGLPSTPQVVLTPVLAPGGRHAAIVDELSRHARRSRIALVGHEPDLGILAGRLIGAREPIALKKGAICRIDFDALPPAGPGHLRWLVTPRMLRMIGKK